MCLEAVLDCLRSGFLQSHLVVCAVPGAHAYHGDAPLSPLVKPAELSLDEGGRWSGKVSLAVCVVLCPLDRTPESNEVRVHPHSFGWSDLLCRHHIGQGSALGACSRKLLRLEPV